MARHGLILFQQDQFIDMNIDLLFSEWVYQFYFLKDFFSQPRPCFNYHENFPMIEKCGSDLTGMPSNHTLNFFLFSTLVHLFLRQPSISFIFFASSVLVALSRVLLIKHLLSQVIIGGLIGIVMAKIFFEAYIKWKKS